MKMQNITLWNNKSVPRMGIGTWVMGGEQFWNGQPTGWAGVDDAVSLRTLHTAFDLGVRVIDTADQYGAGHAERVIAQAIHESTLDRDQFVICTKVGMVCDPDSGDIVGVTDKPADITAAIDASLVRLGVDYLDLVKFHLNHHPIEKSEGVFEAFSRAYDAGKISGFGWSNDDVDGAMAYADLPGYVAVQHDLNLFSRADRMLDAIKNRSLWSFNRQPLAMGLLTGKYGPASKPAGKNDIRGSGAEWLRYFDQNGAPSRAFLEKIQTVRALLTADGRSLAQGALGWCLAQSDRTIPLPGCRTSQQAEDNFGTLDKGALPDEVFRQIAAVRQPDA
jgi:aryl-alcohol dehydrogenase-like predicted oxidoreductase